MSAATILFVDIVGFSRSRSAEQQRLVEALTRQVAHRLGSLPRPPTGDPSLVVLPTGDGMALAFLHGPDKGWDRSTLLGLIYHLQQWASTEKAGEQALRLRIGVHTGAVAFVEDINGNTNVCGDTINLAQRVMDAANAGQVLFSDTAFREHIGTADPPYSAPPYPGGSKVEFQGPIEVHAKHGLQLAVYKMTIDPCLEWWPNDDPISRNLMVVALTPLPKEIHGSFSERLEHAESVALIQLTGDRLVKKLENGEVKLSADLTRLWVFMPDPLTYANLHLTASRATPEYVGEHVERWKDMLTALGKEHSKADLKLGLFREPPYLGGSFIDWDRQGGRIHISPYVWNTAAPDCPGYDLEWLGREPSPMYEVYLDGLRYLYSNTGNVLLS